jgi:methyl-accepting chemotaxis protein
VKIMKLIAITRIMFGIVIGLFALIGGCAVLLDRSVESERAAVERRASFRQLGIELANASDYLTNEARRYVQFGEKVHLDNYWREVKETRTRDRVVSRLKEMNAPQAELDLIELAKKNSDALIATEDAAMKAVEVGDFETARRLMFDSTYDKNKAVIMEPIGRFQEMMNARAEREAEEASDHAEMLLHAMIGLIVLTALLVLAAMYEVVVRRIVRPLAGMTAAMTQLAEGNHGIEVPALGRTDEIGAMAKAVHVFKDNAIEKQKLDQAANVAGEEIAQLASAAAAGDLSMRIDVADKTGFFKSLGEGMNTLVGAVASAVGEIAGMMAAMAHGDLSKRITGDYQGDFLKLKQDANGTAEKLAEIAGQTIEGMTKIKASTTEISSGATDLSSRTEEQVASLEEIAASVRQLNTTVQQSSENAGQASQLAIAARSAAESGGEVAAAAVTAMGEIEQSSQKISEIVGMIDEIAFQTNLLALNAAVEAARAGEAGRGFAVVAGEVRALAQRSSQASKDIKSLILNSSSQVKQGVELVNKAGTTLGEILTSVKRVSDIVAEIAAANKEQSASMGEVQEAIGQIEQATQQNAALVEETTAALGSADNQVQGVTDVIAFFRLDTASAAKPANTSAPAKGAKAVQAKLAARVAAKPEVSPTRSSGAKTLAATGTDDGWEEF